MTTVLLVGAAFVGAAPAGAATTLQCTGQVVGGRYQAVVVPSGASCDLEQATVTGNVLVLAGGGVNLGFDTIGGNVSAANSPRSFGMDGSFVRGDVVVTGGTGYPNQIYNSEIRGDVSMTDTTRTAYFAVVSASTLHGNLYFARNRALYWEDVSSNTIDGNVLYTDNEPFYATIVENGLANDSIGLNLTCLRNNPPPDQTGTTVGGNRSGQCAAPPPAPAP